MGAPGVDGPIQFILPIGNTKSGTLGPLSQQQEISLLQGNMYVNIHSTTHPDGEIRGQIVPTGNSSATTTYTPNIDFNGTDSFLYKISDGKLDSNIATVIINITKSQPINSSPAARHDATLTNEDVPVLIQVLANDTDPDGDKLSLDSIKVQPMNGSSVINSNGTTTYSPNANFFGADKFNYTISDGKGGNATAQVSVTVNPVNDLPIAVNDVATTLQNKAVVINVIANDTDVEKDPLFVSAITIQPAHGTSTINNKSTITYSPQTGYSGTDSFAYQVSDGNGGNSTATVFVNVTPVNESPVVTILQPTNGSKFAFGSSVAFSGQAIDPGDGNISSILTWQSSIDGSLGTGSNIVAPSLSEGVHTITASAVDSGQLSNSSSIKIFVNKVNHPPVAAPDHFKTNEDTSVNMNVIANDSDADNDLISITGIKSNPANGKAIVNSNNNTITYSPDPNFNGQDSLKYTITDSHEGNSTTQVTVDVLPVNDNPIARPDSAVTLQDKSVVVDVLLMILTPTKTR